MKKEMLISSKDKIIDMKQSLYIIIIGCGRLGSQLANSLSKFGHSVVIIDRNDKSFIKLSADFSGFMIEGDATQMKVLREAKAEKADVFIAATHDDNINLMIAQVAGKILNVPRVLARIFDPNKEKIYSGFNIKTICPTSIAVDIFINNIETISKE